MKSYSKLWGLLRTCVSNGRPFLEAGCDTRPNMTQVEGKAMLQTLIMILRTTPFVPMTPKHKVRRMMRRIHPEHLDLFIHEAWVIFFQLQILYGLFNIHFCPPKNPYQKYPNLQGSIHGFVCMVSANPPSLPFSPPNPWMSCKIKGLATLHQRNKGAGVIPISWWSPIAYSKHIYQRCWGLQTTSLYDPTKHIWPKTGWIRGLFPQKNQHHLLLACHWPTGTSQSFDGRRGYSGSPTVRNSYGYVSGNYKASSKLGNRSFSKNKTTAVPPFDAAAVFVLVHQSSS